MSQLGKSTVSWRDRLTAASEWLISVFSPAPSNIDAHCHLFTINTVFLYAVFAALDLIERILGIERSPAPARVAKPAAPAKSSDVLLLLKLLAVWSNPNTSFLYCYLRYFCRYRFTITPLMLDFAYCTDKKGVSSLLARLDRIREKLRLRPPADTDLAGLDLTGKLEEMAARLRAADSRTIEPIWPVDFYGQADQLASLAKKHRGAVFPFLAVDPRRPDILDYVSKNVGPDKPFRGIKLYASTGFSPTDPVLFGGSDGNGKDCLYSFCQSKGIPITAHCSTGGFAYLGEEVEVHGHIFPVEEEAQAAAAGLDPATVRPIPFDGILKFNTSIFNATFDEVAEERSRRLNDPRIWRLVLQRYPDLYLNLAHFGGGLDILRRGETPDDPVKRASWRDLIAGLMDKYDNVYTDLACYTNYDGLKKFKTDVYDLLSPKVRRKVMYGSDWDVMLRFESSLKTYVAEFKEIFSESVFADMSNTIPRRFLFDRP